MRDPRREAGGGAAWRTGRRVLAGGSGDSVQLWDLVDRVEVRRYPIGPHRLNQLALSPDERFLAVTNMDGEVMVLRMSDGAVARRHRTPEHHVEHVSWSPDGEWLAVARTRRSDEQGEVTLHRRLSR